MINLKKSKAICDEAQRIEALEPHERRGMDYDEWCKPMVVLDAHEHCYEKLPEALDWIERARVAIQVLLMDLSERDRYDTPNNIEKWEQLLAEVEDE